MLAERDAAATHPSIRTPMVLCSVDGCNRQAKSLGYCRAHYQRFKKGTSLHDPPLREECSIRGCRRILHRDTFCDPHYTQYREVVRALGEVGAGVTAK